MRVWRSLIAVAALGAISGCHDATAGRAIVKTPANPSTRWVVETLLTVGVARELDLIPIAMVAIDRDSILISDAATMSLRLCTFRPSRCGPPIGERWRPALPATLMRFSRGRMLIATPANLHLLGGDRRTLTRVVDSLAVGALATAGDTIISVPWVGSPTSLTVVPFAHGTAPLLMRNADGVVVGERAWPLADSGWSYGVGARSRVLLAGMLGKELLVVRTLDGMVWRLPWPLPARIGPSSWQLSTSYVPRPPREVFDPVSRQMYLVTQPAVKAVTVVGGHTLGVLRARGYRWKSWNPLMRRPRDWDQELALDAYTADGELVGTMDLDESDWIGFGPVSEDDCVMLWRPAVSGTVALDAEGAEPDRPVVLRACLAAVTMG